MNCVPVNGVRLTLVEIGILLALWASVVLVLKLVRRSYRRPRWLDWLLLNNRRAVLFVTVAALVGRALLLPILGIPEPRIDDEFSHLLMADTFAHGRLTNPTPPAWEHFETLHVNVTPTYHSKYPVAQGMVLAFGQIVFRQPWVGVYLSTALLCGAICWALQAFFPPVWALIGGLLAVVRVALFGYWMNSFWGGSVAALGGVLALGAVMRLFDGDHTDRKRLFYASVFAIGLMVLAMSRTYEGFAFSIPLLAYFGYHTVRGAIRGKRQILIIVLPLIAVGALGTGFVAFYNRTTTGNAALMPYALNERTYFSHPLFVWQKAKTDFVFRDPVFAKYCAVEAGTYAYQKTKSVSGLLDWEGRCFGGDWLFYVGPALSFPVLVGLFSSLSQPRLRLVVYVTITTAAAAAMGVFSQPHYFSPATITVYVFAVEGLRYLWQHGHLGERSFAIAVCLTVLVASLSQQTASSTVNTRFAVPNNRKIVAQQLDNLPGKHLVVVTYDMQRHYPGNELVHNGAEFSSEKILWARSKGPGHDVDLCQAYPDRNFWSVTTDDENLTLRPLDLCK